MDPITLGLLAANALLALGAIAGERDRVLRRESAVRAWRLWHEWASEWDRRRVTQGQMESEIPPGWVWHEVLPLVHRDRRIRTAYELWTEEDVEHGDAGERGWWDEEGVAVPDRWDLDDAVEHLGLVEEADRYQLTPEQQRQVFSVGAILAATEFLTRKYVGRDDYSSSPFTPGGWYNHRYNEQWESPREYRSYFLSGFTEAEEEVIYRALDR